MVFFSITVPNYELDMELSSYMFRSAILGDKKYNDIKIDYEFKIALINVTVYKCLSNKKLKKNLFVLRLIKSFIRF